MPTPAHTRYVISGSLPGGEVFSTGWCEQGTASSQQSLQDAVNAIVDYLSTPGPTVTTLRKLLSTTASFQKVTGYSYGDGQNQAGAIAEAAFVAAGNGTQFLPNQSSLVATTLTGLPGRSKRGRMYWPANGVLTTNGGQLQVPAPADMALAVAGLLVASQTLRVPIVLSRVQGSSQRITQVRVDSRLDVIRARAEKQVAAVTAVAPVQQ